MDEQRFDDLTRSLAGGISRRAVLRRIGATLAGLGLVGAGRGIADAAPSPCNVFCADQPGPRGAQCRQTCKSCAGGPAAMCFDDATQSFTCRDFAGDPLNCGGCDVVCEAPFSACADGQCVCPEGTLTCAGGCMEACGPGERPILANCTCQTCDTICSADVPCPTGGAATQCQNGCCCVPAGSLGLGCVANAPAPGCCSGMCGPDGRCA